MAWQAVRRDLGMHRHSLHMRRIQVVEGPVMQIFYKCRCMQEETAINVTDPTPGADLALWCTMVVVPAIGYHHTTNQPTCQETRNEYVRIPIEEEQARVVTLTRMH
jgi:hypothetical protein